MTFQRRMNSGSSFRQRRCWFMLSFSKLIEKIIHIAASWPPKNRNLVAKKKTNPTWPRRKSPRKRRRRRCLDWYLTAWVLLDFEPTYWKTGCKGEAITMVRKVWYWAWYLSWLGRGWVNYGFNDQFATNRPCFGLGVKKRWAIWQNVLFLFFHWDKLKFGSAISSRSFPNDFNGLTGVNHSTTSYAAGVYRQVECHPSVL